MTIHHTSDLHIGHAKIREYCPERAVLWKSIWEMNKGIVERHNSIVKPDDTVIVHGDVCMGNLIDSIPFVSQLNGQLHLLKGNHDTKAVKKPEFIKNFKWIETEIRENVEVRGRKITLVMRHYPPRFGPKDDGSLGRNPDAPELVLDGSLYFVFGHRHGNVPHDPTWPCLDVGIDAQNYLPITREKVLEHAGIFLDHLDAGNVKPPIWDPARNRYIRPGHPIPETNYG